MGQAFDIQRIRLYLWMGLAYLLIWSLGHLKSYPGHFFDLLVNNLWRTAYLIVVDFIFFEFTIPFVVKKRRFFIFNLFIGVLLLWLHIMFWSFGLNGWRVLGILMGLYTPLTEFPSMGEALEAQMGFSMGSVFFFGIIRHIYNYVKLKAAAQQLRIQKQEAELNYLRSQTNPHFLFNTLNNIYSLARDKSDLAPESVLRLSKILRFMLYETSGHYISIEQELKIINDYIALEKLRYDESLQVRFHHDIENMNQAIPPLLLMPLVENAFKHGVSETRHQPFVDIHLSLRRRQLRFVVKNSAETVSDKDAVKENIGLSNLRRQLELLYREYKFFVQPGEGVFTASLTINLNSHVQTQMHYR